MSLASTLLYSLLYAQLVGAVTVLTLQSLQFSTSRRMYYTGQFSTEQPSIATLLCFLISGFSVLVSGLLLCLSRRHPLKISSMDRGIGVAMSSIWIALVIILFLLERSMNDNTSDVAKGYKSFWIGVRVMAIFSATCWALRTVVLYTKLVRSSIGSSNRRESTTLPKQRLKWPNQPSMSESLHSFSISDKHMNPNPSSTTVHSSRRESQLKYSVSNVSMENLPPLPRSSSTEDNADVPPPIPSAASDNGTLRNSEENEKEKHRSQIFNEIHTDRDI